MKIEYLGHSCFLMTTQQGTKLLTDPYTGVGYELPSLEADIVTCSHSHFDHSFLSAVKGVQKVFSEVGKYSFKDITLEGLESYHDEVKGKKRGKNTVFVYQTDGLRICHMGDLGEVPSADLVNKIGKVDILMLPVGGTYTIDASAALETVRRIGPGTAVAMHFRCKDCTLDIDTEDKLEQVAGGLAEHTGYEIPLDRQGKILIPARKF